MLLYLQFMKRAIIIGASSGIGRQVAQLLIQQGWYVGLAARRIELLNQLASIAPERIVIQQIDITSESATKSLETLISKLGGMGLFFYAAGVGWNNPQLDIHKEIVTIETNAVGFTRMIDYAYHYFSSNIGGHIAVITSIAGTKGLGPAPAYSATKAMQSTYIQALEQMANSQNKNIKFTDIRPGFVATDFIAGKRYPMTMSSHHVAKHIIRAINRQQHVVTIDWRWVVITFLWRLIPPLIWRYLPLARDKQ
jgi:short-subunit dehydrogenase